MVRRTGSSDNWPDGMVLLAQNHCPLQSERKICQTLSYHNECFWFLHILYQLIDYAVLTDSLRKLAKIFPVK